MKNEMTILFGSEPTCEDTGWDNYRCSYDSYYCAIDGLESGLYCGTSTNECYAGYFSNCINE